MDELSILRARVTILERQMQHIYERMCDSRTLTSCWNSDWRKKMKWKNPHQWLNDHVKRHRAPSAGAYRTYFLGIIRKLVRATDAHAIHYLFGEEMKKDGYFEEEA